MIAVPNILFTICSKQFSSSLISPSCRIKLMVKECLYPNPKTDLEMIVETRNESIYNSSKRGKVGKCPPFNSVPHCAVNRRFGKAILRSESIESLIQSSKVYEPVRHSTYQEQFSLKNLPQKIDHFETAPIHSENVSKESMKKLIHMESEKPTCDPCFDKLVQQKQNKKVVEKYVDELAEMHKGLCYPLHSYRTHDHFFKPHKELDLYFSSKERIVNAVWNMLKQKNFHLFEDLESAFRTYDKENKGKISAKNIKDMCNTFGMDIPEGIAELVLKECDKIDHDGYLSFEEFCLFLNMPHSMPVKKSSPEITLQHTPKAVSTELLSNYQTTTSFYKAPDLESMKSMRPAGITNTRLDLSVPKQRCFTNTVDYGENAGICPLIYPTNFSIRGVYEIDLVAPRTKKEINMLLLKEDYPVTSELLDYVWENVNKNDKASIEDVLSDLSNYTLLKHKFAYK